jgi:hypothetical protein
MGSIVLHVYDQKAVNQTPLHAPSHNWQVDAPTESWLSLGIRCLRSPTLTRRIIGHTRHND